MLFVTEILSVFFSLGIIVTLIMCACLRSTSNKEGTSEGKTIKTVGENFKKGSNQGDIVQWDSEEDDSISHASLSSLKMSESSLNSGVDYHAEAVQQYVNDRAKYLDQDASDDAPGGKTHSLPESEGDESTYSVFWTVPCDITLTSVCLENH
ncbi:hypothetical protein ACOMHN_018079 [Nucella lapillus]